jgi:DNA-binding transcriptional MerR regulator
MARHSISEAAKLTGKARSTLHKHISEGLISKETGSDGKPYLETAELVRAYGPLQGASDSTTLQKQQHRTPRIDSRDNTLWSEVEALRREKIERLEARIAELEAERDEWREQAKTLRALTDQRPKEDRNRREPPAKADAEQKAGKREQRSLVQILFGFPPRKR